MVDNKVYSVTSLDILDIGIKLGTMFTLTDITNSYNYSNRLKEEVEAKTDHIREMQ